MTASSSPRMARARRSGHQAHAINFYVPDGGRPQLLLDPSGKISPYLTMRRVFGKWIISDEQSNRS